MATIYLVTHGDRYEGANPGLTEVGFRQMALLKKFLPENPSSIVCGTGRRHLQSAKALGLEPTRYTGAVGVADVKNHATNTVVLADGSEFPYKKYTGAKDRKPSFLAVINGLEDNAVVITSRPTIKLLGSNPIEGLKARVYRFDREKQKIAELGAATGDCEKDEG